LLYVWSNVPYMRTVVTIHSAIYLCLYTYTCIFTTCRKQCQLLFSHN
jgi:hypothetical protein